MDSLGRRMLWHSIDACTATAGRRRSRSRIKGLASIIIATLILVALCYFTARILRLI